MNFIINISVACFIVNKPLVFISIITETGYFRAFFSDQQYEKHGVLLHTSLVH